MREMASAPPSTSSSTTGHAPDAVEAARWLCDRKWRSPELMGWRKEGGSSARPVRPPPTLFTWYGDVDPLKSRQWLIKKLLGETGVGRLAGQWGMFKSVALDIAACVMTGQDFLGRPVTTAGRRPSIRR